MPIFLGTRISFLCAEKLPFLLMAVSGTDAHDATVSHARIALTGKRRLPETLLGIARLLNNFERGAGVFYDSGNIL